MGIVLAVALYFGSGALGFAGGLQKGLVALVFVTMVYSILLSLPPQELKEKTFIQNVRFKIPVIAVLGVIIWYVAGYYGFPVWWQIQFVALFIFMTVNTYWHIRESGYKMRISSILDL